MAMMLTLREGVRSVAFKVAAVGWINHPINKGFAREGKNHPINYKRIALTLLNDPSAVITLIEYFPAPDVKERVDEIVDLLRFDHVRPGSVYCVRSRGSRAARTVARIHGLGRIWQDAMGMEPTYIIEIIAERFDGLSRDDQEKTLIHELLHIPHGFKGGFRHHKGYMNSETVETWYKRLQQKRSEGTS